MSLETILHQGKYDLSKSSGLNLTDRSKTTTIHELTKVKPLSILNEY